MAVQRHGRTLAILGFHKIGPAPDGWETWFYVPQATFVSYLDYLKEDGWQVLDVAAFLRGLAEPDSLPQRAALITFDDGYRSILDYGLPELRLFGYPAVMFVPTAFIGGHNDFDADNEPEEAWRTRQPRSWSTRRSSFSSSARQRANSSGWAVRRGRSRNGSKPLRLSLR